MSVFLVQARLFEGSLAEPRRNELLSAEVEDWNVALRRAEELAVRGFAVWVLRRDASPGRRPGDPREASPYRVVAEWRADGRRLR